MNLTVAPVELLKPREVHFAFDENCSSASYQIPMLIEETA